MSDFRWLIEAPGQRYLATEKLGHSHRFHWTTDHDRAVCFKTQDQADMVMMAVRELDPGIFGFALTLGMAKPVEHGWLGVKTRDDTGDEVMTKDQIKHMVDRFLNYEFPQNWKPDGGISFERFGNKGTPHQYERRPMGTNVFSADQAEVMVRHMIEGMPPVVPELTEHKEPLA